MSDTESKRTLKIELDAGVGIFLMALAFSILWFGDRYLTLLENQSHQPSHTAQVEAEQ